MDETAVTVRAPFMAVQCQPDCLHQAPPLPYELTV